MMKLSRMELHDTEQGFTLVEILVSLVILLLIVTACFPLFSLAAKVTQQNRARLVASELAKRELEDTLGRVTAANYNNENDSDPGGAPLKITTGNPDTLWVAIPGTKFEMRKIVRWVDDPADGLGKGGSGKVDKLPFDYKEIIVEVRCPSAFTGSVQVQADFKNFAAREGTSFPNTGILVEVVRGWTDQNGDRIPVPGAVVTIASLFDTRSITTNDQGQALFPVIFPSGSYTPRTYTVTTNSTGMITRPDQQNISVEIHPYSNVVLQIEVEEPASLTLQFAASQEDVAVVLDGGTSKGIHTQTLSAGETVIQFNDLWPAGFDTDPTSHKACAGGTYTLEVSDMLIYCFDLSTLSSVDEDDYWLHQESSDNKKNLWQYDSTDQAWVASMDNFASGTEFFDPGEHRMAYPKDNNALIDKSIFRPASTSITATLRGGFVKPGTSGETWLSLSDYSSMSIPAEGFGLVYLGNNTAALPSNEDWTPILKLMEDPDTSEIVLVGPDNTRVAEDPDGSFEMLNPVDMDIPIATLNTPLRIRADSDLSIGTFLWRYFRLVITYEATGILFTQPGDSFTMPISGS